MTRQSGLRARDLLLGLLLRFRGGGFRPLRHFGCGFLGFGGSSGSFLLGDALLGKGR